jgi:hypothetical protein
VLEKHEYKYKYKDKPLGVIDKPHHYNSISNYFQQDNRMRCGSNSQKSSMDIWNDEKLLAKMNWHWWRDGVMGDTLTDYEVRSGFRLGTYIATQFKPSVAKAIYEKHNAKNIVDTSCGWGDRLAGFYGTPSTELYVGCDPNPDVFETYKKQCIFYEGVLNGGKYNLIEKENYFECIGKKTVKIWNKPSEDVDWSLYYDTFDMYFTSPPYFDTEKYAEHNDKSEDQSWFRYNTFDKWRDDFLVPVTEKVWKTLKKDAFMMINIYEPRGKNGKIQPLCDDMVDAFLKFPECNYIGKLGMRMMARPHSSKERIEGFEIEPIWCFRKGNDEYIRECTLEDFFK